MKVVVIGCGGIGRAALISALNLQSGVVAFDQDDICCSNKELFEKMSQEVFKITDHHRELLVGPACVKNPFRMDCLPQLPEKQTYIPPVNRKSKRW